MHAIHPSNLEITGKEKKGKEKKKNHPNGDPAPISSQKKKTPLLSNIRRGEEDEGKENSIGTDTMPMPTPHPHHQQ